MITVLVSPTINEVSATTIVAVGATPSITMPLLAPRELAVLGDASVKIASVLPFLIVPPLSASAPVLL
ncbi:hypothetical protein D3C85_1800900 [compost metagenome]